MYTDGAALGNPGPGGYGAILIWGGYEKEFAEGFRKTTNNRMELLAVIVGLEALKRSGMEVHIYSDSKYVQQAVSQGWVYSWQKKGFKGKKNADLWKRYLAVAANHQVHIHWVKGHAGNERNERCDQLASTEAASYPTGIDLAYEQAKA